MLNEKIASQEQPQVQQSTGNNHDPKFWMGVGATLMFLFCGSLFAVYFFFFRSPPPKEVIITETIYTSEKNSNEITGSDVKISYLGNYEYLISTELYTSYFGTVKTETHAMFPPSYPILSVTVFAGAGVGKYSAGSYTINPTIGIGVNYKQHGFALLGSLSMPLGNEKLSYNVSLLYSYSWIMLNVK